MYPNASIVSVTATWVCLWTLYQSAPLHGAELDEALLKRFQNDAPKAWEKQVKQHKKLFAETTGFTINSNQKVAESGKVIQLDENQRKRIRTGYQLSTTKNLRKAERSLQCVNPRYAFELESSSSGEWVITGVYPYQAPPSNESDKMDPYNRIMKPLPEIRPQTLPIVGSLNQVDWLSEEVKIQGIKSISINNRECVEVNIEFPFNLYKKNGDAKELVKTVVRYPAVGVFDPSKDWVLTSFVWMGEHPWKMTSTFSFDEEFDGFPFTTSSRIESRNMTTNDVSHEMSYQRSGSVTELSERDFTLSAFGFPEPTLDQPPPYWLYSSLGGLVLVVVGGVLYKWGAGLRRS